MEERHVAEARVQRLPLELDPFALELGAYFLDVRHAQCDVGAVRLRELPPEVLQVDQVQADVLTELELRPAVAAGKLLQPERPFVEPGRALEIRHRHGHEVRSFYAHRLELLMCRPVISDGRTGKPARPDVGTASGASYDH